MSDPIPLNVVVEDALSESVVMRLISWTRRPFHVGAVFMRGGNTYIRNKIRGFNSASRSTPFLVLTDLDQAQCPPSLIADWLGERKGHNLLFRVAVREVEAWLMADRRGLAHFLRLRIEKVPENIELINDPKETLLRIANESNNRQLRRDLVRVVDRTLKQGPDYNGRLGEFIASNWNPTKARAIAPSLDRTMRILRSFRPAW